MQLRQTIGLYALLILIPLVLDLAELIIIYPDRFFVCLLAVVGIDGVSRVIERKISQSDHGEDPNNEL